MGLMLYKILMWLIALNVFGLCVLILFLINARINLKRDLKHQEFYVKVLTLTRRDKSSDKIAERLNITRDELLQYCHMKNIEIPEEREARLEKERNHEETEKQRILEEEAAWRAEQERILEERRKEQEEEALKRKERLKKFGFR